jgi:hypothetical protein
LKKKFIDWLGLSSKDVMEIKTGYKVLLKGFLWLLAVAIPAIVVCLVAVHYGLTDLLGYIFLGLIVLAFFLIGVTAWAQTIGQDKLAVKEVVTFINSDGTEGSYTVFKKS